ncbi:hypothetical protein Rsub_07706 [Raphidocelis subcapitata]|uniref:Uncharacterized protein n=1 Tax=Raphidocelis subcapitata TaxID=307507 RepID=A0A2V0P852_9CHLO|nr:hypothetical protein Rsub_07706 [Raphidocelis subcapitata]|eukprot:GBF95122.1 hypothetical protein Rsub_07706 [Raphidocelis subcapitata]
MLLLQRPLAGALAWTRRQGPVLALARPSASSGERAHLGVAPPRASPFPPSGSGSGSGGASAAAARAPRQPRGARWAARSAAGEDAMPLPGDGATPSGGGGNAKGGGGGAGASGGGGTAAGLAAGGAFDSLLRAAAAPYRAYTRALESRPLLTKACTSLVGFMIGDLIAQSVAHPGAPIDALRVLRLGLYGLMIDGPMGAKWYDWLEANINPSRPRDNDTVLLKTALDQTFYAAFGTVLFFTVVTLLEGRPSAVASVVATKFWPTLLANFAIWPAAHLVNFKYVPAAYRIAYNNVVAIGWLALLSAITHSKGAGIVGVALASLRNVGQG